MAAPPRDHPPTGSVAASTHGHEDHRDPTLGERARQLLVGHPKPTVSPGEAVKAVAQDVSQLVRAEIELAKAEATAAVKAKATGAAMLVVVAVLGWLGLQGLLITAALALALVLPGWAAALIVTAVLLLLAAIVGLIAKRKLATPLSLETTKKNIEEDVEWTKARLPAK